MKPTISVIIPCYNGSAFLSETLDSVRRQTYPAAEVIVVDDGSTDDSAAIAESFGPPVRVLRQPNRGESVARNRAMDEAKGHWFAFLDADDLWEPDKLARQVEVACSDSEDLVCVYTDFFRFHGTERLEVVRHQEHHAAADYRVQMLLFWSIIPSTALVRADVARRVRFPEETKINEEVIFFLLLRDLGRFVKIPEPLTGYRSSPTQQTKSLRHSLESSRVRFEWMQRNAGLYTPEQQLRLRYGLAYQLVFWHDVAFWSRENALVREFREAYRTINPTPEPWPPSFSKRLYPRWLTRLKDAWDRRSSRVVPTSNGAAPH